ncbi:hypothetical protein Echvi_3324 [Echinicola vietnamensis DSM 17526]|uniref:Uncharacterized protein n=1 Tax=Echinicola vietnamensis (strain DSM 17526 / LMG 23754 / KMM 6221) TaxID=926556 RepID=L0G207_ECHVK|nr:hypothetical protein Echvi_3324 [Echinicola vietnamensis DSM 17526]
MTKHLIDFELFKILFPSLLKLEINRFMTAIDLSEEVYFLEGKRKVKIRSVRELKSILIKKLPSETYSKCFPLI